jgi:Tfp pilus assembly protein PilN
MIQFNLLPDIKVEFIKARRSKRMVLLVSAGVTAVSLVVFVSLFMVVNVLQTKHISDLNKDIKRYTGTLNAIPDLTKILTVQNQLTSLTGLHDQKPISSRAIDYLGQLTPAQATISNVNLDFNAGTVTLTGNADAISTVNKYVDTLKFTNYTVTDSTETKKAFSDVVLSSFSTNSKGGVTYQITFAFDPVIFNGTKTVKLVVPKIISTRSETEKPSDLFQQTNPAKP